jgi:signal transduction histidine kinase
VVNRIVRPIHRLTRDAYRAAYETLPAAVAEIKTMPADVQPPTLAPVRVGTRDELAELGRALSTMQSSAVELAMDQHRADRESAEMLINLGRRNQNLLGRTLSYITELERTEQNPTVLAQLFRLDHATTRIRRGAESMLVLAGATQTRTWSRPVPVADVAQASLSEVEDYQRVDLYHIEDAAVVGTAVADLVHLIAELVENAAHYSPPDARVTVIGQHNSEGGYRLRIIDQGIGMTGRELEEANRRIQQAAGGRADTRLLGLHVVGRLASRRGVQVLLEPSAGRGITATVTMPAALLAEVDDIDAHRGQPDVVDRRNGADARTSRDVRTSEDVLNSRDVRDGRDVRHGAHVRDGRGDGALVTAAMSTRPPAPTAVVPMAEPRRTVAPWPAQSSARPRAAPAVPRRVRGAQLPDPGASGARAFAAPDIAVVRGRLDALQTGVRAARAEQASAGTGYPMDAAGADPDQDPEGDHGRDREADRGWATRGSR